MKPFVSVLLVVLLAAACTAETASNDDAELHSLLSKFNLDVQDASHVNALKQIMTQLNLLHKKLTAEMASLNSRLARAESAYKAAKEALLGHDKTVNNAKGKLKLAQQAVAAQASKVTTAKAELAAAKKAHGHASGVNAQELAAIKSEEKLYKMILKMLDELESVNSETDLATGLHHIHELLENGQKDQEQNDAEESDPSEEEEEDEQELPEDGDDEDVSMLQVDAQVSEGRTSDESKAIRALINKLLTDLKKRAAIIAAAGDKQNGLLAAAKKKVADAEAKLNELKKKVEVAKVEVEQAMKGHSRARGIIAEKKAFLTTEKKEVNNQLSVIKRELALLGKLKTMIEARIKKGSA